LAVVGGGGLARVPDSGSWLVTMYGVVEAAYLLGDTTLAGEAYELLGPYAGLPIAAGPAVSCFGSVEHALGVAQLTLGRPEVAVGHLRAAVAHNTALGHWPAATLARHRLAIALAGTGLAEHRDEARDHAQTAFRDADQLGMRLPTASSPVADPVVAGPRPVVACRRTGRHWEVEAAGRRVPVVSCRGMSYVAVLLANPGHEISAVELATGPHTTTDVGPPDDVPIEQLRSRLTDVLNELERCDAAGDREAAERASTERDLLLARLRLATGLVDRSGSPAVSEDQTRIAVGKAIRRALAFVAKADAEIGAILTATIRTGRLCVYLPLDPLDERQA
jgi:hypothetical protein